MNFNPNNFKPPPVKIKQGKSNSLAKYILVGVSYAAFETISEHFLTDQEQKFQKKQIEAQNKIKQQQEIQKNLYQQQMQQQKQQQQINEADQNINQKQIKYSSQNIQQKLFTQDNLEQLEEINQQSVPSRNTLLQNFLYGFVGANFGTIIQQKIHLFLLKNKLNLRWKFLLITPFTIIPYYYLCGMGDQLQIEDINKKIYNDILKIWALRSLGDYIFYFKIPEIKTKVPHPNMSKVDQLKMLAPNQKLLLVAQKLLRGVYIFGLVTLYNERI